MGQTSARALLAAALTGAALVTGCASASPDRVPRGVVAQDATVTPVQRAAAAASALLGDFVPPPGSARYARQPAGDHGALTSPGGFLSGAMVRDTGWWLASGPDDVIAYEKARLPGGFRLSFSSGGSGPGLTQAFELLPDRAPLTKQYLVVSIAPAGGGKTAVRVDADVAYQPVRPVTEMVPGTARVVVITLVSDFLAGKPLPAPVTVTSPGTVGRLVRYVNGIALSTAPAGAPCSMPAAEIRLEFLAGAGGRELAVADGPQACDAVQFTLSGKPQPPLDGGSFASRVIALAGLPWKVS